LKSSHPKSGFNSFSVRVGARLVAICIFGCVTGFLIFFSPYWMTGIWTALITGALFYEMLRYVNLSERKLTSFLQSLKQNDFTITFSENRESDNYDLHQAFNQLNETFKNLRSDKESQHQLLQVIVSHAAVPLVCFDESNQEVYLINDAAKELFRIPFLQKIDSLSRIDPSLPEFLKKIQDGEKASLKLSMNGKSVFLSVTSRHLLFADKNLKLIALNDVSSELAAKEAEAWQKLLRVLTHEISNSAIPLSTLSSYIHDMVTTADAENRKLSDAEQKDVVESLKTIDQRSTSLKEFVKNFKNVNQVPEPEISRIMIHELINEITQLFSKELEKEKIEFTVNPGPELFVYADKNLTMQALINLVKNAMEATMELKGAKSIRLFVDRTGHQYVNLHIADNGCGILPEIIEQIFVPFYSTKKGGSGIGLSIAHQIFQKQKGELSVTSVPERGSVFTASFLIA
jgi:two-component system, NtrC family, nitrogen regulation sensor histidine kinase NtrY